jgi:hypothetical protein
MDNKWFELGANEQPLDIIKETCGFAGIFKQIGVIGDSLASGEFESHDENGSIVYTDMYEYSWPAVLERITGTKYNNYSRGVTTKIRAFGSIVLSLQTILPILPKNVSALSCGHSALTSLTLPNGCPQTNESLLPSAMIYA